jgi:hypothetical protein
MQHDEAFTVINYTFLPWKYAIADYSLPNNHILHTALVKLSSTLFGLHPWSTRLPAFTAGVLLAPLGYLLARKRYNQKTALFAGVLIAIFPALIDYSTNARGYSLLAFFTLLIFLCAAYVKEKKSIICWISISIFSALGFLNLPIMLLPFGACMTWLFFSGLRTDHDSKYTKAEFFTAFFSSTILCAILTGILYFPALRYSGPDALFLNPYISPLSWAAFPDTLLSRLEDTWNDWTYAIPLPMTLLLILGFFSAIIFHKKISSQKYRLQIPIFLFIGCELLIFRPNVWARIWQFLLPLVLIWCAAGLTGLIHLILSKKGLSTSPFIHGAMIAIMFIYTAVFTVSQIPHIKPQSGDAERAALYFEENLKVDDIVIITYPDDAALTYYFNVHGLSTNYLRRDIPFKQAYVMVNRTQNQSPEQVVLERGPDYPFLNMRSAAIVMTFKDHDLLLIEANRDLVEEAYGLN